MTIFTVERQYLVPMSQHLTIDADTPEAAMRIAMAHEDWDSAKTDIENGRPHHITGCWTGPSAYDGEACPVPREFGEPVPRVVVVIEGGLVQAAIADTQTEVTVVDYDTDGLNPLTDETFAIPQSTVHPPQEAYRTSFEAEVYPARIDEIKVAPMHFDYDAPVDELVKRWMNCGLEFMVPPSAQRVLWRASFVIDGCLFELSYSIPATSIEAATDIAKRCLDEIWPDQVEKLDQSFLLGQAVQS